MCEEKEETVRYLYDRRRNEYYQEITDVIGQIFLEQILYEDISDKGAKIEEFSLEEYSN